MQLGSWGSKMAAGFGSCRGRCGRHWHEIGSLWGWEGDGGMDRDRQGSTGSRCDTRRLKPSSFPWELLRADICKRTHSRIVCSQLISLFWAPENVLTRIWLSYLHALHRLEAAGCCRWNSWGEERFDAYWACRLTWIVPLGLSVDLFNLFKGCRPCRRPRKRISKGSLAEVNIRKVPHVLRTMQLFEKVKQYLAKYTWCRWLIGLEQVPQCSNLIKGWWNRQEWRDSWHEACSERFCCLQLLAVLLAVEQLRKKAAAGRKTPWLWRTSEYQNHVKKLPHVSSEIS